jgi:hypothetical protein
VTQSSWSHFLLPGGRRAARGTTSVPSPGVGVGAEGRCGYNWEEGRDGDTYAGLKQITFNFRKKFGLTLQIICGSDSKFFCSIWMYKIF